MGFLGNDSKTAVVNEVKLFTGVTLGKVVAICPTKEELEKIGIKTETEPVYIQEPEEDGIEKFRLDVYLKVPMIDRPVKVAFFLKNSPRTNKDGNKEQFIDKTGTTCWGDPNGKDWFDVESARPAYIGEEELVAFIKNWVNVKPKDTATFEDFSKIVKGDLSELKTIFKGFQSNEVRVLLTVKHNDGKAYQNVYGRYFDRATNKGYTYWSKHLTDQVKSGYFKDSYSLELKPYVPVAPSADTAVATTKIDDPDY